MRKKAAFLVLALAATLGALLTSAPTQAESNCYQVCFEEPEGLCCTSCCRTAGGTFCTNLGCS